MKVSVVAIDGTKMEANASLAANRTHEGLTKEIEKADVRPHLLEQHCRRDVKRMLAEAEATDAEEDRLYGEKRGDELPEELRTEKGRIERLRECPDCPLLRMSGPAGKERLEREAAERAAEQQRKIDERAAKEAETGRKLRGRKPKEPDPTPAKSAKANACKPGRSW